MSTNIPINLLNELYNEWNKSDKSQRLGQYLLSNKEMDDFFKNDPENRNKIYYCEDANEAYNIVWILST